MTRAEEERVGVSREQVARIAELARLRPDDDTVERLTGELNRILEHVRTLEELDVTGVDESARVTEGALPWRDPALPPDPLAPGAPGDRAPGWADGFFSVPRLEALDADRAQGAGSDD